MATKTAVAAVALGLARDAAMVSSVSAIGAVAAVEFAAYSALGVVASAEVVGMIVGVVTFGSTAIGLLWGLARKYHGMTIESEQIEKRIATLEAAHTASRAENERLQRALVRAGVVDEDGHAITDGRDA